MNWAIEYSASPFSHINRFTCHPFHRDFHYVYNPPLLLLTLKFKQENLVRISFYHDSFLAVMTLAGKSASALAVYGQSREIKLFFTRINNKQELQGGW